MMLNRSSAASSVRRKLEEMEREHERSREEEEKLHKEVRNFNQVCPAEGSFRKTLILIFDL